MVTSQDQTRARCTRCELVQYRRAHGLCCRCNAPLPEGTVRSVLVVYVEQQQQVPEVAIIPMRQVMRLAAVSATEQIGATTKAAAALGIPHSRLKQLLLEAGDTTDYRKGRKARREGKA